ncbi:restriction endonuclease subunit S [Butyrivibrio sp. YAB3001]|uniref:restriction endonuclease subunit S n=1 Tax=Butyrivibrio sp. YAB3001 TaxID=1520812 RepID=UPI0008F65C54|nr:restriction endonuclease subunit S [Butyrivibrio sp. YAB3001]SFC34037.1 type I restriction enzyme, S subunit [Butyrivibrio sp. YAB3001]
MEKIKLGDLCKPSGRQIKEDKDTLIDYIDISAVDNETKKVTGYQTITFGESPSRARKAVKRGNILVSTVRPNLNAVALLEEDTPNVSVASTGFCVLESKDDVDPRFIFNFCKSKPFIDDMVSQATGASYPAVSDKIVRSALIPKYSYQEQQHISNVLDKLAGIIDSRRIELQKLDNLIKARFVELFGDLMENPLGWPVMTIADVSTFLKSGLSRKLSDDDIGLPVIRSGNIQDGQFIFDDVKYWYIDDPQGANTKDYILNDGDVLVNFINSSSQIGKTAIYRDTGRDCIYTTNIFRMKLADNCNEYYYNWFAMSDYYYRHLQSIIQPAVNQASFTTVNFLKLPIPLPPKEKQGEFADFVKQVDKSKVALQKALDETQTLFDSLMQKYFG